jgi:hypothetical protein
MEAKMYIIALLRAYLKSPVPAAMQAGEQLSFRVYFSRKCRRPYDRHIYSTITRYPISTIRMMARHLGESGFDIFEAQQSNVIPVTGRGGPQGSETSRHPHFLDSRFVDGSEVSVTRRPPFTHFG